MAILITGGTKGIGLAIGKAFATPAATVILNYFSDDAAARKSKADIEALGAACHLVKADAGTIDGCRKIAEASRRAASRIDQVVHCAVDAYATTTLAADPERFTRAVNTNGVSLLYLVQSVLPLLVKGSTIFFLSSRGGRVVVPNYAAIGVGKALSESLVRYLAVELAPKGIRVNCIAPSIVETDAVRTLFGDKSAELVRHSAETNPSGRNVEATDYTNLLKFLASPEAEFITGQVVFVNGGSNLSA
jgi:NAD(P)-dependent dehydrogenase (short-subunit alcohol dehydrogenase family)